jgi:hypothetical protein
VNSDLVTRLDVALARNQAVDADPTESRSTLIQAAVVDWLAECVPATPEEMRAAEERRAKRFGSATAEIEDHQRMARIWGGG